ncbi:MAG: hypothetical protein IKB51_03335 [Clostridia bacterium]|nr:hypothetical protein [Clostridia bacterium]
MAKEKITVSIAGIKMNLITSNSDEVIRMANSLDATVSRRMARVGGKLELALLMLVMEQSEALKKNVSLIHSQQEQIFALANKNSALQGEAPESAPIIEAENALMIENQRLRRRIDELTDELASVKAELSVQ